MLLLVSRISDSVSSRSLLDRGLVLVMDVNHGFLRPGVGKDTGDGSLPSDGALFIVCWLKRRWDSGFLRSF